jgi:S1-C subfamily serine protease
MKALIACAALLSPVGTAPASCAPTTIPWDAIVLVSCKEATGTAFHIGGGRYVTANHVVVQGGGGCSINGKDATVTGQDEKNDVAELSGPVIAAKFELDCDGFKAGQEYLAVGFAGGETLTRLPLLYSAFGRDPGNGNGQFIGAETIPGMSGGAMISLSIRVAGIVTQRWPSRARALADTYLCKGAVS